MTSSGGKTVGDWRNDKADVTWIQAFARQRAITDAGYQDAFEAAHQAKDWATCNRIASEAGHAYVPPLGDSENGSAFAFARVGDIIGAGLKPVVWIVRHYIEADSLALMFGDPGCGKSFAAIDLACCVATGTPWHGNKTTPGPVFYVAGEGQNGLARRFAAWAQHNSIPLSDAPLFTSRRPAQLCNAAAAAEVANAVEELIADTGAAPSLIVVDTLARNFGGDENSQEDMGAFIANLDGFLRKSGEWDATVLVVHHSGHADKTRGRGSSAMKGAVDAEYSLTKDETGVVRVEATKMKDAENPPPVAFRLQSVAIEGLFDDEGEPVTSAVLWGIDHAPPAKNGKAGRGKNQTRALAALRELFAENRKRVSDSGRDADAARVTLDEWRARMDTDGMNRFQIRDVIEGLRDRQVIELELGGYVSLSGPL